MSSWPTVAQTQREWEISRIRRQEAERKQLADSLMNRLEDNSLVSFSYGNYFLPGWEGVSEKNTYVNIRDSRRVVSIGYETFLTNHISAGIELGFHFLNQTISMNNSRIKGGGGLIATTLLQINYVFPPVTPTSHRRLYVAVGSGLTQTVIASLDATFNPGSSNPPTPKIFMQTTNTITASVGQLYRISRFIAADMSLRYFHADSYSPYIGSVRSFSPFQIDLKLSGVFHSGIRRAERKLRD